MLSLEIHANMGVRTPLPRVLDRSIRFPAISRQQRELKAPVIQLLVPCRALAPGLQPSHEMGGIPVRGKHLMGLRQVIPETASESPEVETIAAIGSESVSQERELLPWFRVVLERLQYQHLLQDGIY